MNALRRNVLILATGVASIGGGALAGLELQGDGIVAAVGEVQQYENCATLLARTATGHLLPHECRGLVAYKQPVDNESYPVDYSSPASDYTVDRQGYATAKTDIKDEVRDGIKIGILFGVFLWGGGLVLVSESRT